jgi:hypothetical protein
VGLASHRSISRRRHLRPYRAAGAYAQAKLNAEMVKQVTIAAAHAAGVRGTYLANAAHAAAGRLEVKRRAVVYYKSSALAGVCGALRSSNAHASRKERSPQ